MEPQAEQHEVRWGAALALVAMAISVSIATVLYVRARSRAADVRAAVEQLDALCLALVLHHDAVGRYPSSSQGLRELWGLGPETLTDPWGHAIGYSAASDQQSFVLRASAGIELASTQCTRGSTPDAAAQPGM